MKKSLINYIFNISTQPVIFANLLQANKLLIDGMHLDGKKLGFRLKTSRAYMVFLFFINLIFIFLSLVFHSFLVKLDCHVALVLSILSTGLVFVLFGFFKDWIEDEVSLNIIQKSWNTHFSYFPYEEYHKKVNNIYTQAISLEISKNDLQKFIFDKLSD